MLDSDDLVAPTALEKLVLFAEFHPSRSYVYSGVRHFGEITGTACDRFDGERLKRENFLAISCLIRRDLFLAIGGFDEALLDSYEDYDLWLRLLAHGHEGALLPEPLFSYRRRTTGYSAELARQKPHDEMIAILRARHPALFGGPEPDRSGWKLLPPQATSKRARWKPYARRCSPTRSGFAALPIVADSPPTCSRRANGDARRRTSSISCRTSFAAARSGSTSTSSPA